MSTMADSIDRAALTKQRLAALITQRRAALGWSQEKAADEADVAYMTYRRLEEGQRVQPATYAKVEVAFGVVPGGCRAVLDGGASLQLTDGSEILLGSKITPVPNEWLEDGVRQAVTNAMIGTLPGTTGEKIRELNERVIEELRQRGVLPAGEK